MDDSIEQFPSQTIAIYMHIWLFLLWASQVNHAGVKLQPHSASDITTPTSISAERFQI